MKIFFFLLICIATFALWFVITLFIIEMYAIRLYRRDVNAKIMRAMFKELGFSYRETSMGKKFLIIDKYEGGRAIQV